MKVERELCLKCLHLNEFHLISGSTGETRCVHGQPVHAFGKEWKLTAEDGGECTCREFRP